MLRSTVYKSARGLAYVRLEKKKENPCNNLVKGKKFILSEEKLQIVQTFRTKIDIIIISTFSKWFFETSSLYPTL